MRLTSEKEDEIRNSVGRYDDLWAEDNIVSLLKEIDRLREELLNVSFENERNKK